jgi:hypothetical protein
LKSFGEAGGTAARGSRFRLRGAAVLAGALALTWPAFLNGFPLLYPDSLTYLAAGSRVARALFLHQFSDDYGLRSAFYSLGILAWHWDWTPWPVAFMQCLLVAWVLWLGARSFAPRFLVATYLVLILFLSFLTGVGWYAVFIMPDILGSVLYLAMYLLAFAPETLSRRERLAVDGVAWWCVAAHASHLFVASALCVLLLLLAVLVRRHNPALLRNALRPVAVLLVAVATQVALYTYLYGTPSLNGRHPPFVMARILSDGPGRWYLDQHCSQLHWLVCSYRGNVTTDPTAFLWGPSGTYEAASEEEKKQLEREELPFLLATLRAYPQAQLARSTSNFVSQLGEFALYGFGANPWIPEHIDASMRECAPYLNCREAHDTLPMAPLSHVERWALFASLAVLAASLPLVWLRRWGRLAGLGAIVTAAVLVNAMVTGVLSGICDRYECRVIWLVPLVAFVALLHWLGLAGRERDGHGTEWPVS